MTKQGALYCANCYDENNPNPEDFKTAMALAIHIELLHRGIGKCSDCGRENRYIAIGDEGDTWCVDDGQCVA